MRIDAALAERLQADAGHEPFAREAPAFDVEFLMVNIQAAP